MSSCPRENRTRNPRPDGHPVESPETCAKGARREPEAEEAEGPETPACPKVGTVQGRLQRWTGDSEVPAGAP
eukprot:7911351-Pyramimonas_sp.AAC.1